MEIIPLLKEIEGSPPAFTCCTLSPVTAFTSNITKE